MGREPFQLYEIIGEGYYGKVYRAIKSQDKKQYAIKVVSIQKLKDNKQYQQLTINQINTLSNLKTNNHILCYYDMLKTAYNFYFIYQYCNGGTLSNYLQKQGPLSQERALQIFFQLLEAFKVLSNSNIMHKNLKPDNIFLHNGIVKLGDFKLCTKFTSQSITATILGSPTYWAPQVLRGQQYSSKADIWSLGCVLYEMLFNKLPYKSSSIPKLITVIKKKSCFIPQQSSFLVKQLITKMLTKDTDKRISWPELFQIKSKKNSKINNLLHHKIATKNSILQEKKIHQRQTNQKEKQFKQNQMKEVQNNKKQTQSFMLFEHFNILKGIKLYKNIIKSKIINYKGLSSIVLNKTIQILSQQYKKCLVEQTKKILYIQLDELKKQYNFLIKQMFSFQLNQIQDWRKYLRGKYFGQKKDILLWFEMIHFLQEKQLPKQQLTNQVMSKYIRNVLY